MRALLLTVCCLFSAFAHADRIVRNAQGEVRLFDAPCDNAAILAQIGLASSGAKKAHAIVLGKRYAVCWFVVGTDVMLIYEDGARGSPSLELFQPVPNT